MITVIASVTLACAAQTRLPQPTPPARIVFSDIRHFAELPQAELPTDFATNFTVAGYSYKVAVDGRITSLKLGTEPRSYRLRLPTADFGVDPRYYQEYEGDALVLCRLDSDDGEVEATTVARLDPRAGRVVWQQPVPSLNVGQPLVEDGYAYVAGYEFIGKVDLATGAYVWQHKPPAGFDFIRIAGISGDVVRFREHDAYRQPGRTIALDKRSGKPVTGGSMRRRSG